jgi:hypothetical protein
MTIYMISEWGVDEDVWEWQHEIDYYERTAHLYRAVPSMKLKTEKHRDDDVDW